MGISRHDRLGIPFGLLDQSPLQLIYIGLKQFNFIPHPQPQIGSHLVIAAASGMEFFAGFSDAFNQGCFNRHVNIFLPLVKDKTACFNLLGNFKQSFFNCAEFGPGNQSHCRQHLSMNNRAGNIMLIKTPVPGQRLNKIDRQFIGGACQPLFPAFFAVCHLCSPIELRITADTASIIETSRKTVNQGVAPVSVRPGKTTGCPRVPLWVGFSSAGESTSTGWGLCG